MNNFFQKNLEYTQNILLDTQLSSSNFTIKSHST